MPTAAMVTTLVLTALVIDRIVATLVFLTTYLRLSRQTDEVSRATAAEYRRKMLFVLLSGSLAAVALAFVPARILPAPAKVEPFVTWLVLVAASDRIAGLMGTQQAAPAPAPSAGGGFHVTGTLALDEESAARLKAAAQK
jgi:hypothetical protein